MTEATPLTSATRAALEPRYQPVRVIGAGGMGFVVLARDTFLHRNVAIKLQHPGFARDDEHRELFLGEARLMAQLSHPGIVPVFDFIDRGGTVGYVMPYCAGSLASRFAERRLLTPDEAERVLDALGLVLDHVHRQGILHRDIKPENVFLTGTPGQERMLLGDFGIAETPMRDRGVGVRSRAIGSPGFCAPEQILNPLDADRRSDLYALGVVGYMALTGARPFEADTPAGQLAAQQAGRFVPIRDRAPRVPRYLVKAVEKCLAPDPRDRWLNASAFRLALLAPEERSLTGRLRSFIRGRL